ncbi:MAG: zinc metallopeptidase [Clostridia bacterium]|nr:zinc metallopeptidase [Clostridia bacterium]
MDFESLVQSITGADGIIGVLMIIVLALIALVTLFSAGVSIYLAIKYVKFNRRKNSRGMTGVEVARKILDDNGLQNIKVKTVGSMLFGNSYSHYFKKVRLRRMTRNKTSVTAMAMGSQKAALAVLDKEGDPDMQKRVKLVPLITFGPFAFIPLIIVGVIIDLLLFNASGVCTVIFSAVGVLFFVFSLVLSVMTLKTEIKAQNRAYELLKQGDLATDEEIEMMKELFKLYNIQYVNDIILAALELIYRILQIAAKFSNNSNSSNN